MTDDLHTLADEVVSCRRCPRLVSWREQVARERRAAFKDEVYWGKPLPGFGDPQAKLLLFGLAPAAHGGNRTGRIFTGDRSGDFLVAAMWRVGLASMPTSRSLHDGLKLHGVWMTAAVRCAPPANKPTAAERDACLPWSERELALLPDVKVILCLGGFGWDAALRLRERFESRLAEDASPHAAASARPGTKQHAAAMARRGRKPRFGHGAVSEGDKLTLVGCYHPSQQNTFTGRLTEEMLETALRDAATRAGLRPRAQD